MCIDSLLPTIGWPDPPANQGEMNIFFIWSFDLSIIQNFNVGFFISIFSCPFSSIHTFAQWLTHQKSTTLEFEDFKGKWHSSILFTVVCLVILAWSWADQAIVDKRAIFTRAYFLRKVSKQHFSGVHFYFLCFWQILYLFGKLPSFLSHITI